MLIILDGFAPELPLKQCPDAGEAFVDGFGIGYPSRIMALETAALEAAAETSEFFVDCTL